MNICESTRAKRIAENRSAHRTNLGQSVCIGIDVGGICGSVAHDLNNLSECKRGACDVCDLSANLKRTAVRRRRCCVHVRSVYLRHQNYDIMPPTREQRKTAAAYFRTYTKPHRRDEGEKEKKIKNNYIDTHRPTDRRK